MILYGFNSRNKIIKKKEKEKVWEVEQKKKIRGQNQNIGLFDLSF